MKIVYSIAFFWCLRVVAYTTVIPEHLIHHADSADKSIQISHKNLSIYLCEGTVNDEEKILIFSYWIAKNIHFNMKEVRKCHRTNKTAYEVLRNKKAVCEGYSILFQQFCQDAGIESYIIYGHGYGGFLRRTFTMAHMRHAWNAVYLNGEWQILDVTWASSEMKHTNFNQTHELKWILCEPSEFAKSHYPNDPRWQLLKNPLSKHEFWSQASSITDKNYNTNDSLNILAQRERFMNELIICKSEYLEQGDAYTYLKNLIHLGWTYVGGAFESEKIKKGIHIFNFAKTELKNLDPALDKFLYEPEIKKGLHTAQVRLESKE